jgi:hypothetical protein
VTVPRSDPRVTVTTIAIGHHAGRSGYRQLVTHLPVASSRVEVLGPRPLPRWMPPRLAARLVEPARPRWYRDETFALELEVGRQMLARRTDGTFPNPRRPEPVDAFESKARDRPPRVFRRTGTVRVLLSDDARIVLAHDDKGVGHRGESFACFGSSCRS